MAEQASQPTQLSTLDGCRLVIGRYPAFRYDGRGGGGPGLSRIEADGRTHLHFPADRLAIPPLDRRSTRWLGLPLPPGLSITIAAERLEGYWDPESGALALDFQARFRFRIGGERAPLYRAPDLQISCCLSSGHASGERHQAHGRPRNGAGDALLVGVARVEPSGERWLDRFLGLPDDALAVLQCRITAAP